MEKENAKERIEVEGEVKRFEIYRKEMETKHRDETDKYGKAEREGWNCGAAGRGAKYPGGLGEAMEIEVERGTGGGSRDGGCRGRRPR